MMGVCCNRIFHFVHFGHSYWLKGQFKRNLFIMHAKEWAKTAYMYDLGVADCKINTKLPYLWASHILVCLSKFCMNNMWLFCAQAWCTCCIINDAKWPNASAAQDASIALELISARCSCCWGLPWSPPGMPALRLSSLFVPDSLQWCHSVGRSRGCLSACLCVPLLLSCTQLRVVLPLVLSCLRNWNCLNCSLCDIMVHMCMF